MAGIKLGRTIILNFNENIMITCGKKQAGVSAGERIEIDPNSLGCSILGRDDLYDKGIYGEDLETNPLVIELLDSKNKITFYSEDYRGE